MLLRCLVSSLIPCDMVVDMRAVEGNMADMRLASPLLTPDVLEEALPGSIRKAEHFIAFLKKVTTSM